MRTLASILPFCLPGLLIPGEGLHLYPPLPAPWVPPLPPLPSPPYLSEGTQRGAQRRDPDVESGQVGAAQLGS